MYPVLCPRCGLDVCYFRADRTGPYCGECGWNLDSVSEPRLKDRSLLPITLSLPPLVTIMTLVYGGSWRRALLLFGASSVLATLAFFAGKKQLKRMQSLVTAVSQKRDANLSSDTQEASPTRVLAYEEFLRQCPRQLRPLGTNPVAIWIMYIVFGLLLFVSVRPLFSATYRLRQFQSPALYALESTFVIGMWYLFWKASRQEPPLEVQLDGEICLARVVPATTIRGRATYEFWTASGNLVRVDRRSNTGALYTGTFIPVYYDRDDPTNCFGACDLLYELVLPNNNPFANSANHT